MKNIVQLLTLCLLIFSACSESEIAVKSTTNSWQDQDSIIAVFENSSNLFSEKSIVKLSMKAPIWLKHLNGNEIYPEGLEMELFDEQGTKKTNISADYGIFRADGTKYTIYGNVVVANLTENQTLKTDTLHWDKNTREIYTYADIDIVTAKEQLKGKGLRAAEDFSRYTIQKPTGIFSIDNN